MPDNDNEDEAPGFATFQEKDKVEPLYDLIAQNEDGTTDIKLRRGVFGVFSFAPKEGNNIRTSLAMGNFLDYPVPLVEYMYMLNRGLMHVIINNTNDIMQLGKGSVMLQQEVQAMKVSTLLNEPALGPVQ